MSNKTIASLIDSGKDSLIQVKGNPQEMLHPYYLTAKVLSDLLNQQEDHGVGIFEDLNPKEITFLSRIFPQLEEKSEAPEDEDMEEMGQELAELVTLPFEFKTV